MRKPRRCTYELLEPRQLLAANPIISEFMASNGSTLEDGNGASSDWIEIYNNGDQSVDLFGYGLTDNASDLDKWSFPSYDLDPGEFLVVFASGNDEPDSAGNLHTNFSLSASGEYLALVDPSETILSEFGSSQTDYPAQTADISYGLAFDTTTIAAVTPNSSSKYFIPQNSSVDNVWTDHNFNDSSWNSGSASLGYDEDPTYDSLIQTTLPEGTTSAYVRIEFTVADASLFLDKLQMKYDDGFIAYINGEPVASDNAPGTGAYNSRATADHPDGLALQYVDFDVSEYSHLLHVGTNTLAIHMLNRRASSSDFLAVPNLVLSSGGLIEPQVVGSLTSPTPRLPNTNLRASDVLFSRVGGTFESSFQLTITSSEPNETIRFTTNGSIPDENSQLYTTPLTITSSTQLRARAFGPVGQIGPITTEAYTRTDSSTANFTSDLPIVVLENFSEGIPGEFFEDAHLALYEVDSNTGRSSLANLADVTSIIGQHRRGSSTFDNPKINLRIETRDNKGEDKSIPLLGMPSESDWILYAPYKFDRAMLRNTTYYELSRQMGNYAARTRFVEVYTNYDNAILNDDDYMGVYVLMENIKRDSNRVDIAELTPTQNTAPDITGGYILRLDRSDGTPDSSWFTDRNIPTLNVSRLVHDTPERLDLTLAQRDYIRGYIQDFEDALFGPNSTDPDLGYQAYFDVDASIDHHLIRILSKERDSLRLSTFLTKDRGGKLAFGPVWDFDRSSGPDSDTKAANPLGWFLPEVDFFESDWWGPLFDDPNFMQRWVDRWQELRTSVLSDANLESVVLGQAGEIEEAQSRNFARWTTFPPNGGPYADPGLTGWEAEVSQLLNWITIRANWMDEQLVATPSFSPSPGNIAQGTQISLTSSSPIYYTLDGSDPRADGGGISTNAILYTGSITADQTTQINARSFATSNGMSPWSRMMSGLFSVEVPADASSLRITELHYHPANPTPAELSIVPDADDDDFEFVELLNVSNNTISLNGVTLSQDSGPMFNFSTGNATSLAPGARLLVVKDEAAFTARYGPGFLIAGEYSGNLSNGGQRVILTDGSDQEIHNFEYDDIAPWPTEADGDGPSLEIIDPLADHQVASNWRSSASDGGTPGEAPVYRGDFDQDSDVDGADFLIWQQGFGSTYDESHLADWETNYGQSIPPLASPSTASTEPALTNASPTSTIEAVATSAPPAIVAQSDEPEELAIRERLAFTLPLRYTLESVTTTLRNRSVPDNLATAKSKPLAADAAFAQWEQEVARKQTYLKTSSYPLRMSENDSGQSKLRRNEQFSLRSMFIEEQLELPLSD